MKTLAVIPSLPVHMVAPRQALLTRKFVEGMCRYADLWDGPVIAVMHSHTSMSTGNLDDEIFYLDKLPFDVEVTACSDDEIHLALADADVVMLGADHRHAKLPEWCKSQGKKSVYVTEYTLRTRMQIIDADTGNPLLRLRRYLWDWQQEQRNRQCVRIVDAVQCNGLPTFNAYKPLNENTLLFFDSRINQNMLANPESMSARQEYLHNKQPIRLAFSGRLNSMKGADHLMEVAKILRDRDVPFKLDIFGDGPLLPSMEQRLKDYQLEQQVLLHGAVDYASELIPYIRDKIDLFVCCHRQGDPACTYIETFACGVPIVGYANEALLELTRGQMVGWTTPLNHPEKLAQKIAELTRQPQELCKAGDTALEFAISHTFEKEFSARIEQLKALFRPEPHSRQKLPDQNLPVRLPLISQTRERLQNFSYRKQAEHMRRQAMSDEFPDAAGRRFLLVSQRERIPQSQIFPFHFFSTQLNQAYDTVIRETDLTNVLDDNSRLPGNAEIVAFQMPYDMPDTGMRKVIDRLRHDNPNARMIHLDWSAPTDLRNAERLNPHIDFYVKKHALRDRDSYGKTTLGETNLSDHYARRMNLDEKPQHFPIPSGFMQKLVIGPSFVTAPLLLNNFLKPFCEGPKRNIDLHARFAVNGTLWYEGMRSEALIALKQLSGLTVAAGRLAPLYQFITELRQSKACFSPFGYGEVCWRDYEAIMAGSVLLKPDMSHIETNPDIFRPWETYVPLRWDFSDFKETLERLIEDPELRLSIAQKAHSVLHTYISSNKFVDQMSPILESQTD